MFDLDGGGRTGVRAAGPLGQVMDGEWSTGGAYPSGEGNAGGDFLFRMNVMRGDADRSLNRVNAADLGYVRQRLNRSTTSPIGTVGGATYTIFGDVLADGPTSIPATSASSGRDSNSVLPVVNPLSSGMRIQSWTLGKQTSCPTRFKTH